MSSFGAMGPHTKKYPCWHFSIVSLTCVVLVIPCLAQNPPAGHQHPLGKFDSERGCVVVDDELCLLPDELPNYEAIKTLHSQLDDDRNGDIDVSESVDFLKEELQYAKGYEKRQKVFHYNNDEYISVRELWAIWKKSEVHSWTVEQTVAWLAETVELKQYAHKFYENAINGSVLPRLATNNEQFLTKVLGIRDPKHRSKITIKAMDVVLFGPPKESGSHIKDLVLVTLLTLALIGCFKAYQRNREYEKQLGDMLLDMEKLREAEEDLRDLELRMNSKVQSKEADLPIENNKDHDEEVQQLRLELAQEREKNERMHERMQEQMKRDLEEAELEDQHWCPPVELQHWLQLTFERERVAFEKKQKAAREQFVQAREMCEKLNRQRQSLMGVLASVHGKMDNVDKSISCARTTLEEVTQELGEKNQRWKRIEILAGCSITSNAGLHTLELMLRPQLNGRPHSTYAPSIGSTSCLSASLDDFDDETLSLYTQNTVQQLLSNQSALMFLTMGGSSYPLGAATGNLNSSAFIGTPRESMVDVRDGSTGSTKKRSQLIARDSGSSLGSESSINQSNIMHHSHTFSSGLSPQNEDDENIRRVNSVGSLNRLTQRERERSKDSNDSSNDDAAESAYMSETMSFTMGGSQLTLDSMSGAVSQSQVSNNFSAHRASLDIPLRASENNGTRTAKFPKRNPMLKSLSQDACTNSKPNLDWKEISASEPALDSQQKSSAQNKRLGPLPTEEGNSSDSSVLEERPSMDPRKKPKSWFRNGIPGSLRIRKSKKQKDSIIEKESVKDLKI